MASPNQFGSYCDKLRRKLINDLYHENKNLETVSGTVSKADRTPSVNVVNLSTASPSKISSDTSNGEPSVASETYRLVISSARKSHQISISPTENDSQKKIDVASSITLDIEDDLTSFSIIDPSKIKNSAINNKQASSDMWFKLFIGILLRMDSQLIKHNKNIMIDYCRSYYDNNVDNTKLINDIEMEPNPLEHAIEWYTRETFLYKHLNTCLRQFKIDELFNLQFFIVSLHNQLKKLYAEQFKEKPLSELTVFRGEQFTLDELSRIKENIGGLLTINRFLSTTRQYRQAKNIARTPKKGNRVGVILEIKIDCNKATEPFADISNLSRHPEEQEILFSVATVFRIQSIDERENIYCLTLLLTNDVYEEQTKLTEFIMEEKLGDETNMSHLGQLMMWMGEYRKALEYYDMIVPNRPFNAEKKDSDSGIIIIDLITVGNHYYNKGQAYNGLGCIDEALECFKKAHECWSLFVDPVDELYAKLYNAIGYTYLMKGKYQEAVDFFEKAIEVYKSNNLLLNNVGVAVVYCNMGMAYAELGEFPSALTSLQKAIEIQESLPKNHYDLATSYHNIAIAYSRSGNLKEAIKYYQKNWEILTVIYEENHPRFGILYNCIGKAYYRLGDLKTCIGYYEKALRIQTTALTSSPYSDIVMSDTYNNLGEAYVAMNNLHKALEYHKEAEKLQEQHLQSNQSKLVQTYREISRIYRSMEDFSNVLLYNRRVLETLLKAVPPNYDHISIAYSNTGLAYCETGENLIGLKYYSKAEEIQTTISPNHYELAKTCSNIGSAYQSMKEYSNAHLYFEKARQIRETRLPPNHSELGRIYLRLGILYMEMNENSNSLLYYEKAREIWENTHSSEQRDLATLYFFLGGAYKRMNDKVAALFYAKKARNIQWATNCPEIPQPPVMDMIIAQLIQEVENY